MDLDEQMFCFTIPKASTFFVLKFDFYQKYSLRKTNIGIGVEIFIKILKSLLIKTKHILTLCLLYTNNFIVNDTSVTRLGTWIRISTRIRCLC